MGICSIDGCGREIGPHGARGWCSRHYKRWLKRGDPLDAGRPRGSWLSHGTGEASNVWKGDRVSYGGAHSRVRRARGTPTLCEHCGGTGPEYDWALSHEALGPILIDPSGRAYSPNPADYIRLCPPCHVRYDKLGVPRTLRTSDRFAS